jgi:hypothetical protein
VARELLMAVWRRQAWPMQSMGFAQWDLLADILASPAAKQTFPGNVLAELRDGRLRLTVG